MDTIDEVQKSVKEKGYIDIPIDKNLDLVSEIEKLKKEKGAVILGHYYQGYEIQDISDFVGDSLALSRKAAETNAEIIMFAGVHFMAETAKILSPQKKVLIPDLNAGCSLARSCPTDKFANFINRYPDHLVISYVNTTARIKAMTDIACTSTNAVDVVESLPKDQKIIFAPDRNLGTYINKLTGRDMIIWNGACHVHEDFSLEKIFEIKKQHPEAKLISHPECTQPVLIISDFIGSTAALLNYVQNDSNKKYIVATESGILHQMTKTCPDKIFIPAPPEDSTCACNDCKYMRMHNLQKLYLSLKYELPEVIVEESIRIKAEKCIRRMLEIK